jgi:nitroreductase
MSPPDDTTEESADAQHFLSILLSRQSSSPKRLVAPGPTFDQIQTMIAAAVTAPDHRGLRPWSFILIADEARPTLGELFLAAKARLSPDASADELQRERERALRAPTLLAVVARIQRYEPRVEERDQYASVGAAIQNVLLAAHAMGYGAIMLSGRKTRDRKLVEALGLTPQEELMGFICLGTHASPPARKARPDVTDHLRTWHGLTD